MPTVAQPLHELPTLANRSEEPVFTSMDALQYMNLSFEAGDLKKKGSLQLV
jgi:hypothetical protein